MSNRLFMILLRHGVKNIKNGGMPFFLATLMSTLGLYGLAVFATFFLNTDRVTTQISDAAAAVVFLDVDGAAAALEVETNVRSLPGIKTTTLVAPDAVKARAQASLGQHDVAIDLTMPWVIEVARQPESDETILLAQIKALPGVNEVLHPTGELERIGAVLKLFRFAGLFLLVLVGSLVIVVVSNSVKITLYARREEIAIMKLVGATDAFVRVPFLIEGLVQGLMGALLALLLLAATQGAMTQAVDLALAGAFSDIRIVPLPLMWWLLYPLFGAVLGTAGSVVSIGRFLKV